MNPESPVRVGQAATRSLRDPTRTGDTRTLGRPFGTPHRRAEAVPRPTGTETKESPMTTTTTTTALDWRDYDDRDNHQDRLATELIADDDEW